MSFAVTSMAMLSRRVRSEAACIWSASLLMYRSAKSETLLSCLTFIFFFQAEDGIRDIGVTGVQTCALPIYGDEHLGGGITLRDVRDLKGQALIDGVMQLVDRHRPLHLSIVGGEPLVRFRELNQILPRLAKRGVYTQLVTSAVRPIPQEWIGLRRLQIVVSIDGLQPEHDERRKPATYDRILKHISGHAITVHCTVTSQQVRRDGYLEEFTRLWSDNPNVRTIWFSLYTPQVGEVSVERLTPDDRRRVVS